MFKKILIANRGEIGLRIARACRELGIRVVAVHSTVDAESPVVRYADESVQIGPAPARRSYLNIPAILEAARRTGAEAIHPGYGFLAENPDFAEACEAVGVAYIGPPAPVIAALGDKPSARELLSRAGLPLLPGSLQPLSSVAQARRLAEEIGYPVIVKAAGGGGGRGMRVAWRAAEFDRTYRETRAQAQVLFGDGRVYVERYLPRARHVEIQILADQAGTVVHLGSRDCTVQRRHQKLIEEAPAPKLPEAVLEDMGRAAVVGARAAGYVGAGTFEFLVDAAGNFYFLEVNCRIQVEHPVTEMVTGVDLVQEQVQIAAGRPLPAEVTEAVVHGAAIECRINAEDPRRQFIPTPGLLSAFTMPAGPFTRVDTHAAVGYRIPSDYDSLLAKVVVWAPSRAQALDRMDRALEEVRAEGHGIATTADFLREVLQVPQFRAGEHDTAMVGRLLGDQGRQPAAGEANSRRQEEQ
jgi:acetyl-CoA carboxylase, biotin carboxylase subunit